MIALLGRPDVENMIDKTLRPAAGGRACGPNASVRRIRPCFTARVVPRAVDSGKESASDWNERPKGTDLDERILSGEFTDSGSTKEKLTRPVRKLLAQDPVGVGTWEPEGRSSRKCQSMQEI